MIPHHQQAIQISNYAETNTTTAEIVATAMQIKETQNTEMTQMSRWLRQWGVNGVSKTDATNMAGEGTLTDEEFFALKRSRNQEFNNLFLQDMINHHQGAISMAQDELANGINNQVLAFAQSTVKLYSDDVTYMQNLLDGKS